MSNKATVTITLDGGDLFVDATCDETDDLSLAECLGIIELAKDVLIRGEAGE